MPFAIGSETWGSIRYPAAFCGVTGLRPSFGRVSRHGTMALSATMDKLGPWPGPPRTAGSCWPRWPAPIPRIRRRSTRHVRAAATAGSTRRYRIGVLRGTLDRTQPEVRENFLASLALLGEIADVVERLELPDYPVRRARGAWCSTPRRPARSSRSCVAAEPPLAAPEDRVGGYAGAGRPGG